MSPARAGRGRPERSQSGTPGRLGRRGVLILVIAGVLLGFGGGVLTTLVSDHSSSRSPAEARGNPTAHAAPQSTNTLFPSPGLASGPAASLTPRPRPSADAPTLRPACATPSACQFPDAATTGPGSTSLTRTPATSRSAPAAWSSAAGI